jgi:hypothetical protein
MYGLFEFSRKILLSFALSVLLVAPSVAGEAAELQALRAEIADLRERVESLEKDLRDGVAINPARQVNPRPGGWKNPKNWRLLAKGMMGERVEEILGAPQDTKTIKNHEIWYYGDGKVTFYLRRLKSFDEPGF